MQRARTLVLILLFAGCGSPATPQATTSAAPAPAAPASAPPSAAPAPAPSTAPFAVRFARSCPEWSFGPFFATRERLLVCGLAYDTTGALVGAGTVGLELAAGRERVITQPPDAERETGSDGSLAVYDATLQRIGTLAGVDVEAALVDGSPLYASDDQGLAAIDPSTWAVTRVPNGGGCAGAVALADAPLRCVTECDDGLCLRTVADGSTVRIASDRPSSLVHVPDGWLLIDEGGARIVGDDGTTRARRGPPVDRVLAQRDDRVLVALEDRTELWTVRASGIDAERVYDVRAEAGAFVGDRLVLRVLPDDVVWLERGAPPLAASPSVTAPQGARALSAAAEEGGPMSWVSERGSLFARRRADLAAFEMESEGEVVVWRIDPAELGGVHDDVDWARRLGERVVPRGSERWASLWSRTPGARVLRGHTYIGGCERTNIDVLAREQPDGSIEVWSAMEADAQARAQLFGPEPADPQRVLESDRYEGDPSIGRE
jgi:hypothetical protein